jgi:retron-type reverse transcriptase
LEECLGKVLESVQASRLAYYTAKYLLVPSSQFGGRPGSSTVDAALSFVHDIEAARNHGLVTLCITFDIKGYFDFVNHTRLLRILCDKHLPLPMIKWVKSFLSERQAAICLDGVLSPSEPVENGIPQGSPISPALSIICTSPLNETYNAKA